VRETRICEYCGGEFTPRTKNQKCCQPRCSHLLRRKYKQTKDYKAIYQRERARSQKGRFRCPKCERWHDEPAYPAGDYRQYCKRCRERIFQTVDGDTTYGVPYGWRLR